MNTKLTLLKGDITKVEADAIVNAANTSLLGGGGVDGAIHQAGGPAILEECRAIRARQGGCETGEAVITNAGNLPASYVIHTVGPVWRPEVPLEMDRLLENCYINSLAIAKNENLKRIAFPNISTGAYHFPKERAAKVAIQAVRNFLNTPCEIEEVIFVCFDQENYNLYGEILESEDGRRKTEDSSRL